jgi:transposase-like protein
MVEYRKFSNEQKRQVAEEALSGEMSKSAVARKHQISYSLLDKWINAYKNGRLDNEPTCEAGYREKIEKLEQMIGRQAMEIEFLKKAITHTRLVAKQKERLSKNTDCLSIAHAGGAH